MEILKGLLSQFKEILYDILGYMLPGYLLLLILSIPLFINQNCSPMYGLLEIFFKSNINVNLLDIISNASFLTIIIISFAAYLLGHIPIFLSHPLGRNIKSFLKLFNLKKNKDHENTKFLCKNILNILQRKPAFRDDLFKTVNDENKSDYNDYIIKTFASTYSRFTSHNDLIQKYTCKVNFYNSLSCLFFIMFIDSLISTFIWVSFNSLIYTQYTLMKLLVFNTFIFLFYITFFKQYQKHCNLKNKECYLFLYKYFS
ncbi:hypothetical protein [Clostridium butyricum]|uniref:Uncharacterized protein n=1 Tax=Clostridium butyricum TaxID=1492 RepID=A0A6N3D411_CLOBU